MREDAVKRLSQAARCRRMLHDLFIENGYPRTRLGDSLIERCKLLGIVCVTRQNGATTLQLGRDGFQRNGPRNNRATAGRFT